MERELDYYLYYVVSRKMEQDRKSEADRENGEQLQNILGHVEGVINSYREGLIYFMQDRHLCKEDTIEELRLQAVLSDYNRQLQAFTERLAAYGCGRLAWEVLKL